MLVDERSASASEIVAGALQDWIELSLWENNNAFGKVSSKSYYLNDGSLIRLTVAKYCSNR